MPLNADTLCALNAMVLDGLALDEGVEPGVIRKHPVGVSRYRAAPAEDCEFLLNRLGEWLDEPQFSEPPSMRTELAIIRAVLAHLYLAWIHPFGDGNGRTARLVELQILLQAGAPTPAAHLLSNHYNLTRTDYYRQLDYASRSNGNIVPFVKYAVRGLLDGLREQLARIREYQRDLTWLSIVHAAFDGRETGVDKRKKHLILDISKSTEPVKILQAANVSNRCAAAYAHMTAMTLKRDLFELHDMKLIAFDAKSRTVAANKSLVDAFLPRRVSTHVREDNTPAQA
jgi:Fic family protein